MLNKPKNCVSAVTDPYYKTVLDLITGGSLRPITAVAHKSQQFSGLYLIALLKIPGIIVQMRAGKWNEHIV